MMRRGMWFLNGLFMGLFVFGLGIKVQAAVTIEVRGAPAHKNAHAQITVKDGAREGQKQWEIRAHKLEPTSIYTVWFMDTTPKKKMVGVGKVPYVFTTDAEGKGYFSAAVGEAELGEWPQLTIMLHRDGSSGNTREWNLAEAFIVDTSQLLKTHTAAQDVPRYGVSVEESTGLKP